MKLAAHPLVVAVALGLLDASALTGLDERDDVTESHCPCGEMTAEECSPAVDACVEDDGLADIIHEFKTVLGQ